MGAVAERDRAIVVGFKPVDRELHCPGIGFADVGKGKRNRRVLVEVLIEPRRGGSVKRVALRIARRQCRRDRPVR